MVRYHDNNNHAGRGRAVKEIMLMYYWVGVTEAVKTWIKACAVCRSRGPAEPPAPPVHFCLAYDCDASSYVYPELTFHRFPKAAERRRRWLVVAQRDEGSLRNNSCLCSRHFEPSCFTVSEEGQLTLMPDAVPTIISVKVPVPSDENFLDSNSLEDLLSTAGTESTDPSKPPFDPSETAVELQEHQYCLPGPDPDSGEVQTMATGAENTRRQTVIEPSFKAYNQIANYLSHRVLPMQSKRARGGLKRMAKRFGLQDGVLMYTRVSPPLRVPRSREEVNSILQQFHDNQGHYGQGICQREISKQFYWASMTRDLARWISSCHTCLNRTKRKWLRCSVSTCTNCCGPVERGLGLTFHKFPLNDAALLARWLKAVGRPNWHPRLGSSVCSTHFTEDCFHRGGEKLTLHPDAVPTLVVHGDLATPSRGANQPSAGEEAYFAKYDAVERYLSTRTYPAGLSYVEKNTFRRFCKKFAIKDDELHMWRGDRALLVLRSRQRVEAALMDYHNELNHLDVHKCLRLLNERYFWKTMRSDVVRWINSCSQCCQRRKKPHDQSEAGESLLEAMTSPQIPDDGDSGKDGEDYSDDDDDEERPPATLSEDGVVDLSASRLKTENPPETPVSRQPRIPILLHLRTPIILQPRTPTAPFKARLWPVKTLQGEVQKETSSSDTESRVPVQPDEDLMQDLNQTRAGSPGPPPDLARKRRPPQAATGLEVQSRTWSRGGVRRPLKRKADLEADSSAKRSSSCGLDPVVASSSKPWPVFTIAGSAPAQTARPPPSVNSSSAPFPRPRRLQARTVIQQCRRAKVKIKPALDSADAQWAEIQDGLVVYVCFFHGATEDVAHQMANSLMTTKLFRKDRRHSVSVLDLPGSVLLIPQDSLLGEPVPPGRVQSRGGCELWWGAQLFSTLASACRELASGSARWAKAADATVEHGVYGQKQEMVLYSEEPLTLLLEF